MKLWPSWYNPMGTRRARVAQIIDCAARLSGIPADEIAGPSRKADVTPIRFAVCQVAMEHGHSSTHIGGRLGQRDHTTVLSGCKRALHKERADNDFCRFINGLRRAASQERPTLLAAPATIKAPDRVPHIKKVTLATGEEGDNGHRFHDGIAKGSAALLKALAA